MEDKKGGDLLNKGLRNLVKNHLNIEKTFRKVNTLEKYLQKCTHTQGERNQKLITRKTA